MASVSVYEMPARTLIMAFFFDAELHGDRICGLESNTSNVARQAVWVFGHDLNGINAIGFEDPHRPRRADAVAVQENHDLADDLLFGPSVCDALGAHQTNTSHLAQPVGLNLDDIEHLFAERPDHLLGVDRPDATDHAGAEVFLDAVNRRRGRRAQKACLELLAMGVIVDPFSRSRNPLPGRDNGGVADDRHQIAMAASLCPQNTKPIVTVMEGDTFDKASQNFLGRRFRLMPRHTRHEVPSSVAVDNSLMVANCRARSAAVAGLSRIRSSSSSAAALCSCRSHSTRAMCVRISCGVNISLT